MGKVQKKLGRLHDALANFNQALDLDPKAGNMIKAHIDRLQVQPFCVDCRVSWESAKHLLWNTPACLPGRDRFRCICLRTDLR